MIGGDPEFGGTKESLQRAGEELLAQRGYPKFAEHTVRGAAIVYMLLGRAKPAEDLCRAYLARHPEAQEMHGVIAMAL